MFGFRRYAVAFATSLALLALFPVGTQAVGKPGDAGFLPLRLGVGARETGMGDAGVASAVGAAAVYWNPANLAFAEYETELLLQHQRWLGLFNKEAAALAHRTSFGDLGFFFTGLYSDPIDRYVDPYPDDGSEPEGPAATSLGTFRPHDVVFGLAFARKIVDSVAAGFMVKYLHEKIDLYSDSGLAFDFFVSHRAVIEGLRFGASLTNMGSQMKLNEVPYDLPAALRIGAAYDPQAEFFAGKVTCAADLTMPNDGNQKMHLGAEYRLLPELALRLGSKINYDSQGLTAGAGFRKGILGVGYAFEDLKNDLDPSHKFTLELHY